MDIKLSILIIFFIIFILFMYYLFTSNYNKNDIDSNRYITFDEFNNFMNIILEKKNNDKGFNNYIKTNYTNTVTYKQLNYALDKINNNTVVNIHKN
jgi:cbb3-type cytochrome oxidase subunit 3